MRSAVILATLLSTAPLSLITATAFAQEAGGSVQADTANLPQSKSEDDPTIPGALVIGAGIGAIFPQPFTALDTHVAIDLELGYRLPFWDQRLEIFLDSGFSPPHNSDSVKRAEGTYDIKVTEQELHFSLGPRLRVMERSSPWNIAIALGPRVYFLRTYSNGSRNGQTFQEYYEESGQWGFFVALGGEYTLGPGALFLNLDLGWSKLPHCIAGQGPSTCPTGSGAAPEKVSSGNITALIGYRFFLL